MIVFSFVRRVLNVFCTVVSCEPDCMALVSFLHDGRTQVVRVIVLVLRRVSLGSRAQVALLIPFHCN